MSYRTWKIRISYSKYTTVETTGIADHELANNVLLLPEEYTNRYEANMEEWRLNYINNQDEKAFKKLEHFKETHPEYFL